MSEVEQRYEKWGKVRPCHLEQDDLVNLARLIQKTFTRPEIERYFRVSTTLNGTRVFYHTMADFLVQGTLPDRIEDLSFWIEGWDHSTRFDKTVLLDVSRYSAQLKVEGTDPVWVYDKFNSIMKFLKNKTVWYWPIVMFEKIVLFSMTLFLISSLLLCFDCKGPIYYVTKVAMFGVWCLVIFYDTRKIWPLAILRVRGTEPVFSKENVSMMALLVLMLAIGLEGLILPLIP